MFVSDQGVLWSHSSCRGDTCESFCNNNFLSFDQYLSGCLATGEIFVTRYENAHRYLTPLHYIFSFVLKDMYRVHLTFRTIESHPLMDILDVEVSSSHLP